VCVRKRTEFVSRQFTRCVRTVFSKCIHECMHDYISRVPSTPPKRTLSSPSSCSVVAPAPPTVIDVRIVVVVVVERSRRRLSQTKRKDVQRAKRLSVFWIVCMCKQYGNVDTPLVPVCIEHVLSGCKPGIVVRCVWVLCNLDDGRSSI
jgi:hypothetical protein